MTNDLWQLGHSLLRLASYTSTEPVAERARRLTAFGEAGEAGADEVGEAGTRAEAGAGTSARERSEIRFRFLLSAARGDA